MDFQEAFNAADAAIVTKTGKHLTDAEKLILEGAWNGQSYEQIADAARYSPNYLQRDVGRRLWKRLSDALGEEVSKTSFRTALERHLHASDREHLSPLSQGLAHTDSLDASSSTLYVNRDPVESQCYESALQPGALIRIKAPQQMGKTLLMNRVLEFSERQHCQKVLLNLLLADETVIRNLETFLRWFCTSVSRRMQLSSQLSDFWDPNLGSSYNCTAYFEEYLLPQIEVPLVLGLDNVDRVFSYQTVAQDFFGLLRAWHEAGNRGEIWQKLRLIVAHSTEVYIPLNVNQSPFNVGLPIDLPEFNNQQVKELVRRHGVDWDASQVEQLMETIGGHPYLVDRALSFIKREPNFTLKDLLQSASTEEGIYSHHLRKHWLALKQDTELANAMKIVTDATEPVRIGVEQAFKLESMGLVNRQGNDTVPRCNLYRLYFRDRLGSHL